MKLPKSTSGFLHLTPQPHSKYKQSDPNTTQPTALGKPECSQDPRSEEQLIQTQLLRLTSDVMLDKPRVSQSPQ